MKRLSFLVLAVALIALPAAADTLQIQVNGLQLNYNGNQICDANSCTGGGGNPAFGTQVASMSFFLNNTLVGTLTNPPNTALMGDVIINVPGGIAVGGNTAIAAGGIFDLFTNAGGWGLAVDLAGGTITDAGAGNVTFALLGFMNGNLCPFCAQNLPFLFNFTGPVEITISTTEVLNQVAANGVLTGFNGNFHADVTGPGTGVPEPGTLALFGTGLIGAAGMLRRRLGL